MPLDNAAQHTRSPIGFMPVSARYIYWGLARLVSNGPLGSLLGSQALSETQQDEFQYVFDGNACGEGVTIYVLDEPVRTSHKEFDKTISSFKKRSADDGLSRGEGHVGETVTATESKSHGTFVAAIAAGSRYGVAKDAKFYSRDIYLGDQLIEEMENFRSPAVINISSNIIIDSPTTCCLIKLIKSGFHVVVAAGNEKMWWDLPDWEITDDDATKYGVTQNDKVHLESLIWVGASTSEDERRSNSNCGPRVDLFAPGDLIVSATNVNNASKATWGGTSFATPHVSGIIACLLSHPRYKNLTPKEMKAKVLAMASQNAMKFDGDTAKDMHGVNKNVGATTTKRLASCRLDRWTLGDAEMVAKEAEKEAAEAADEMKNLVAAAKDIAAAVEEMKEVVDAAEAAKEMQEVAAKAKALAEAAKAVAAAAKAANA